MAPTLLFLTFLTIVIAALIAAVLLLASSIRVLEHRISILKFKMAHAEVSITANHFPPAHTHEAHIRFPS